MSGVPGPWAVVTYAKSLPPEELLLVRAGLIVELAARSETTPTVPIDLSVRELAARFGRAESTIRGWLEAGEFPGAYLLHKKQWRVPPSSVAEFQQRQSAPPAGNDDLSSWRRVAARSNGDS